MGIRDLFDVISEAVFPSNIYCEVCGCLIDRSRPYALCDRCVEQMHWITGSTCGVCGKALPDTFRGFDESGRQVCYDCRTQSHYFTRGWSCLSYGLHERELMMGIKYSGKGYLARKMGDVLFDRVDAELLRLFAERMRLVDRIGAYKAEHGLPVRDEGREAAILARVREQAGEDLADEAEALFCTLTALSRARQEKRHT